MTSIVIWSNYHSDEYLPGLWAISDSRVSASGNVLTDNFQKLTALQGYAYNNGDFERRRPRHVFTVGVACAGSTLISTTVRDFMSAIVSDLQEVEYTDAPNMPFEEKIPSLQDIAKLMARVATQYVLDMGQHYPRNARIEIALYGLCPRNDRLRIFKIQNSADSPASVTHIEVPVGGDALCIMGERTDQIERAVRSHQVHAQAGSLQHARAPIAALWDIAADETYATIGGPLQLSVAGRFGVKSIPLMARDSVCQRFVGIDLTEGGGHIGGFSYMRSLGLCFPWNP